MIEEGQRRIMRDGTIVRVDEILTEEYSKGGMYMVRLEMQGSSPLRRGYIARAYGTVESYPLLENLDE